MPDQPILKIAGIYTSANEYSSVPEGALSIANNCVIRSPNIIEPRRGQKRTTYSFGATTDRAYEIFFYGSTPIIHYGTLVGGVGTKLSRDTGAAFSDYSGTYNAPDATLMRMKAAEAQQCFYFTTDDGVMMLDATNATPEATGIGRPPDPDNVSYLNGALPESANASNPIANGETIAYRILWYKYDAFGRLLLGPPSGRVVVKNTSGSDAHADFYIPRLNSTVNADWGYRVYRSDPVSGTDAVPPDAVYLVRDHRVVVHTAAIGTISKSGTDKATVTLTNHTFRVGDTVKITSADANFPSGEYEVRSANYGANSFEYDDNTVYTGTNASAITVEVTYFHIEDCCPIGAEGEPLYTNLVDGEGDINANDPPPIAHDIAWWSNRMFYANTTSKQRFFLRLLGVDDTVDGHPLGLRTADTITIAGQTYTAGTSFSVIASGSAYYNIETTAQLLVEDINTNGSNTTVWASYISGPDEDPGHILIEERSLGGSAFSVYASRPSAWSPGLTNSSTGAFTSSADVTPNRLYFSKRDQPEAVPLLNYLDIGSKSKKILRIVPLRDRLFVFKEDGIYVVSGEYPFRVDLLDDTVTVIAPDSVQSVANQIFAWTNQGVVAVSDAGVRIVSKQIDRVLTQVSAVTGVKLATFGVSYESDRQYILCFGSTNGYSNSAWVYNIGSGSGTWTYWPLYRLAGRVNRTTDLLYMSPTNGSFNNRLVIERKAMTFSDFADDSFTGVLTIVGEEYRVPTPTTCPGAQVGSTVIGSSSGAAAVVSAVTVSGGNERMTLWHFLDEDTDAFVPFETGETITVYNPFQTQVEWLAQAPGGPNQNKQFSEVTYHFRDWNFDTATATFNGYGLSVATADVAFSDGGPNTGSVWEQATGSRVYPRNKRVLVPQTHQYTTALFPGFKVNEACAAWTLCGVTIHFNDSSERNSR